MREKFDNLRETALAEINNARNQDELEKARIKYLGRKGEIAEKIKQISSLPKEERPAAGKLANDIKAVVQEEFAKKRKALLQQGQPPSKEKQDLTMPGYNFQLGHIHPITQTLNDICNIFRHMGFAVVEGPEIETEYNNFEALNIPLEHPSRDVFDTFYVKDDLPRAISRHGARGMLLRSHTSPVQIRYMKKNTPPLAIIVPGRVYRPDAVDASHSFMFHQVEGLMVAEDISFSHLKGTLLEFGKQFFGKDIMLRFRPHFFPFTEPSAEVDVSCIICKGTGCSACSNKGWLEILGAGMVEPAVFKTVGIDGEKYTGLAFGMGVERIAMLKYGIGDIRLFFENDLRFLGQF